MTPEEEISYLLAAQWLVCMRLVLINEAYRWCVNTHHHSV